MFCSKCGHKNEEQSSFCTNCGNPTGAQPVSNVGGFGTNGNSGNPFPQPPKQSSKNTKVIAIAVGGVLVLGAIVALSSGGGNPIPGALSSCGLSETSDGVSVDSDGKTVYFDGSGEEDFSGVDYASVKCVLEELKAPNSIFERIGSTTALQGVVEGEWGNFRSSWTYHPDNGLDLTLETK